MSDLNALTYTLLRANTRLQSHQFESLVIEFCGKVLENAGADDEYVAQFTTASDMAQFGVALRCFSR